MKVKFTVRNREVIILSSAEPKIAEMKWGDNPLYSIIERTKEKRTKKGHGHIPGDNCPMLYAMKQADNLWVHTDTENRLYNYARLSIDNHFGRDDFSFDAIVTMPSKHDIGLKIAKIFEELFDTKTIDNLFVKRSASEAIQMVLSSQLDEKIKQSIKTALSRNKLNKLELKNVDTKYRKFVPVLKLSDSVSNQMDSIDSVLLVDDILSSGSTLDNARKLLQKHYPNVKHIGILTLFGPLSKKFLG